MRKFLHVGFNYFGKPELPHDKVTAAFGAAEWAQYAPNCWIVHTDETPYAVGIRLHDLMPPSDSVFVCEFASDTYFGWLPQHIWDWMTLERGRDKTAMELVGALMSKPPA